MDMLYPSRNKNCLAAEQSLNGFPTHQLVSSVKCVVESRVSVSRNGTGPSSHPFLDLPLPAESGGSPKLASSTGFTLTPNGRTLGANCSASARCNQSVNKKIIIGSNARFGAGIYASGDNRQVVITNNIIVETDGHTALYCTNLRGIVIPLISFNNVFAPQGTPYGGQCTDQTGSNSNISDDPLFVDPTIQDYRLQSISSSIDKGDNFAPGPFAGIDIEGQPRFVDGNGDGNVVIDMGAYEFGKQLPLADAGNDQALFCDHNCRAVVTLNGRGSSDPDGDTVNFIWTGSFGTATGPTPSVTLPVINDCIIK